MKRMALLLLLFAPIAEAQIKQITGGGYQNSNGVACAGCILYLQLPVDATVIGTGQIVPNVNSYQLDANGNVPANSNLWANDQLNPTGLTYKATLTNAGGGRIWGPEFLSITGTSPISLTQLVPVASSSVFFNAPALLGTTATQTFSGNIVAPAFVSGSANPAQFGIFRLANGEAIDWRNNANNGDVGISKQQAANGNIPADTLTTIGGVGMWPNFIAPSASNSVAVAGNVRLATGDVVNWRNNANGADLSLAKNSIDQLTWPNTVAFGGAIIDSNVTTATLTGTGACATFSGQVGGQFAGSAACASATAASTLTIGSLPVAAHGYVCNVQDETTRANLFQQTSHGTNSCTLTATSVTQNDVFVFTAIGF